MFDPIFAAYVIGAIIGIPVILLVITTIMEELDKNPKRRNDRNGKSSIEIYQ